MPTDPVTQAIDATATSAADTAIKAAAAAVEAEASKVSPGLSVIAVPLVAEAAVALEHWLAVEVPVAVKDIEGEVEGLAKRFESWCRNVWARIEKKM